MITPEIKLDRIPPHDMDAESAIIGSLLIDGKMIDEINVSASDFYHAPLKTIFTICQSLKERGTSINQITVARELDATGNLESTGGVPYLIQLSSQTPTSLDAPDYADIVRNLATQRRLIEIGNQITELGFNTQGDISVKFDDCDKLLLDARVKCAPAPLISPKDRADMMMKRYQDLTKDERPIAISTGLIDLDRQLGGGLQNGEFYVLGARPKMGKSTFLMQLANHCALSGPVLFASAEMPVLSITDRDVAQIAGVPINVIRSGKWTEELTGKIMDAIGRISERNVYFYWQPGMTSGKILQVALGMQARHGLSAVFIDYLGLLADEPRLKMYERITYISHRLNEMKLTLNVPVFTAHQLSRDLEQQERKSDRRPRMSDLRDSGAIEQDADVVLMLYRDNYYDPETTDTTTELIIAANRQGNTGKLKFNYQNQMYRNIARES